MEPVGDSRKGHPALLVWADLDSSEDDDTDVLAIQAADELGLMLVE